MSLAVVPLLIFGLIVILVTSGVIYKSLKEEVRYSLNILAHSTYEAFELLYPGDYSISDKKMKKGNVYLAGRYDLVDHIKDMYKADTTLFCMGARYLTTIKDEKGNRTIGTSVSDHVKKIVLDQGKEYFSDNIKVGNKQYFGYYIPIYSFDSVPIGMIFVGRTHKEVMQKINRNILMVCLTDIGVMVIAITISFYYSKKIIYSLNKTKKFLGQIAKGDLTAEIDHYLLERQDEIGEMGRFAEMLQNSISALAGKDQLTELYNRRSCDVVLESLAEKCRQNKTTFSVAMGDIDYFKNVNDTYGHQAGDEVLKRIAHVISEDMERIGFAFRWGGEEFLLIYEDMKKETAIDYLNNLQKKLALSSINWKEQKITFTMTFGLVDYSQEKDIKRLIQLADSKLYQGKKEGRNRVVC